MKRLFEDDAIPPAVIQPRGTGFLLAHLIPRTPDDKSDEDPCWNLTLLDVRTTQPTEDDE